MALNKEIWLPEILEGFYADDMFLSEARNFDAFVENDKINLAEAGVTPNVLINNTTYPIAVSARTDVPISMELDTYDTENTIIRNIETAELNYDKRQSVLYGHRKALQMKFMEKAIHAYAPQQDGTFTPVIPTTGIDEGSRKSISFEDIMNLESKFDDAEVSSEGRILVLSTTHKKQLRIQDAKLYKEIFNSGATFCGFKLYSLAVKRMPYFDITTGQKQAFGSVAVADSTYCSIAFHKDEVMRCRGTFDMFADLKNPKERGDIYGFQGRGLAMPIRNKGIGVIYSDAGAIA